MAGRAYPSGDVVVTRFLTIDELIYINEQLLTDAPVQLYVKGKQAVRDMDLLEAAAGRPQVTVFGEDAYPSLAEKAAALLHSLARNHPFADGNKRTAAVAAIFMLAINGERVCWEAPDALEQIVAVAEGRAGVSEFAQWLATEAVEPTPEPDADRDKATITLILADHRWLLDELAGR